MTGREINKILNISAKHVLYREDGEWYHRLKWFPGALFDKNGYIIFQNEIDYKSNPRLQHGKELHVTNGIASLQGYVPFTKEEKNFIVLKTKRQIDEETIRNIREIEIIRRNRKLVSKIKRIYNNTCQICGKKLEIKKNILYAEVHHLMPLGKPHNGPDRLENMICVCPNHHVLLDCFAMRLNVKVFKSLKHKLDERFLDYYNSRTN